MYISSTCVYTETTGIQLQCIYVSLTCDPWASGIRTYHMPANKPLIHMLQLYNMQLLQLLQ